jgi:RimJ/RimL family protein N-acetyltransferase
VTAPVLETERLIIRRHRREDFDAFAGIWAEPEVVRFIGGVPFTREQSWMRFLRHFGMWNLMGFGFFALEDRATGVLCGEAGFLEARRDIAPSLEGTLETGWALSAAMQGRGLAEEAVRAILAWGSATFPEERKTCMIESGHAASLHVAGKLGFRRWADGTYQGKPMVLLEVPVRGAAA